MVPSRVQPMRSTSPSAGAKMPQTPYKRKGRTPINAGRTPEHSISLPDDVSPNAPSTPAQKRKATNVSSTPSASAKKFKSEPSASPSSEKRLRKFRSQPPQAFHDVYDRAMQQRFYVLKRTRRGTEECPEEIVEMTGSTGNVYTIHIAQQPRCNCPHAEKGNQCKHVLYVLNAPFELVYQLALLSSELRAIFAVAPLISQQKSAEPDRRKPVEGDCPICYYELEVDGAEAVVWCQAACGQNIHEQCFQMWARTKKGDVTCPMCRTVWQGDEEALSRVSKEKGDMEEGYVNVAAQLGISRERDVSTYAHFRGLPRYLYPLGSGRGSYRRRY